MDDTRIEFLYALYFIGRKIKSHYKKKNTDVMLTAAILHSLSKQECTLSKLSEKVYSKVSSLSEKITVMQENGLLRKSNTEDDERETILSITSKGEKYSAIMLEKMKVHCMEFTKRMSNKNVVEAMTLMQKLLV
ncbi:MAG: MarR family winged helix-turn-helix transcriptional regulator [bacterium]